MTISGRKPGLRKTRLALSLIAGLVLAVPAMAEAPATGGKGQAVVTILPKKSHEQQVHIEARDLEVKVNGGLSDVTGWTPLRGANSDLEVVVLIDGGASAGIGNQLGDVRSFLKGLPPDAKVALAYMENGRSAMAGPLSTDHAAVARELRLPSGIPGSNASPYFCLSDLAQHWPSTDAMARREVVMITNGVDEYGQPGDMQDQYVQSAIRDAVKSGLVVYSIYWSDRGQFGGANSGFGQSLMTEVTEATGGASYYTGMSNPVSLQPYLQDIEWRLENQYRLSFASSLKGKPEVKRLALHVGGPAAKVVAPQQVYVTSRSGE
jgi:hypothetical protein